MVKINGSQKGTTLVETMSAVMLFSLVMGSLLEVSIQGMAMGKRSEYAYNAYNLAKDHIETLKSMPFSNLANAAERDSYVDMDGNPNATGPYIRNTTVGAAYAGDPNLVQIQVSVNYLWKGAPSANVTRLNTVISTYT